MTNIMKLNVTVICSLGVFSGYMEIDVTDINEASNFAKAIGESVNQLNSIVMYDDTDTQICIPKSIISQSIIKIKVQE